MATDPMQEHAMPRPRDKHLVRERDRHGNTRWYVRVEHGPRIRIRGEFGSPEFLAAVEEAKAGRRPQNLSRRGGKAGTVQWAVDRYLESARWATMKPATRKQRENFFLQMTGKIGDQPITAIDRASIKASLDARAATPFAARNWLKTMRALFDWLVEAEIVAVNVTTGIRAKAPRTAGFLPWSPEDHARFTAKWALGTRERLIYEIAANTGLRRGDIARLGRVHLRNGWIQITTEKTGTLVEIPMMRALEKAIEAGPCGDFTFVCVEKASGKKGEAPVRRPMTKESMANLFADACRDAGLVRKSLHGIRKSAATLAAENDFTESQLNAWFGWADGSQESATYTKTARRRKLAEDAGAKLRKA
jgi:integrase